MNTVEQAEQLNNEYQALLSQMSKVHAWLLIYGNLSGSEKFARFKDQLPPNKLNQASEYHIVRLPSQEVLDQVGTPLYFGKAMKLAREFRKKDPEIWAATLRVSSDTIVDVESGDKTIPDPDDLLQWFDNAALPLIDQSCLFTAAGYLVNDESFSNRLIVELAGRVVPVPRKYSPRIRFEVVKFVAFHRARIMLGVVRDFFTKKDKN